MARMSAHSLAALLLGGHALACTPATRGGEDAEDAGVLRWVPHFREVSEKAGIALTFDFPSSTLASYWANTPIPKNELIAMIGGVACDDIDNDGWLDLFVLGGANGHHLYRNQGDGQFSDQGSAFVAEVDAFASGPLFADFDADGLSDLIIAGIGERRVQLLRNSGEFNFEDVSSEAGLHAALETIAFGIGDADHDADLDVLAARWGEVYYPSENDPGLQRMELLWQNDGSAHFTDQSPLLRYPLRATRRTANGELSETALTPNFTDLNEDGKADLLLAQDFDTSAVMLNETEPGQPPTLTDITDRTIITEDNAMGSAIGDYDNDGDLDWFVTSVSAEESAAFYFRTGNRLYRNEGDGTFSDATDDAGVRNGSWGWAACFADFNNDGWLDLYHVNGWGYADPTVQEHSPEFLDDAARLFLSDPAQRGSFVEVAQEAAVDDRGQGRGVVCFDYDRDGDVDVLVTNSGGSLRLFQNQLDPMEGGDANYLNVRLDAGPGNHRALGARLSLTASGHTQTRELRVQNNYLSQDPAEAHFGLGTTTRVERLRIVWPDGTETLESELDANQQLVLRATDAR